MNMRLKAASGKVVKERPGQLEGVLYKQTTVVKVLFCVSSENEILL